MKDICRWRHDSLESLGVPRNRTISWYPPAGYRRELYAPKIGTGKRLRAERDTSGKQCLLCCGFISWTTTIPTTSCISDIKDISSMFETPILPMRSKLDVLHTTSEMVELTGNTLAYVALIVAYCGTSWILARFGLPLASVEPSGRAKVRPFTSNALSLMLYRTVQVSLQKSQGLPPAGVP